MYFIVKEVFGYKMSEILNCIVKVGMVKVPKFFSQVKAQLLI